MYNKNEVIKRAGNEVGYLEKASNNMLMDPIANPGDKNFTKYGAEMGCNGQPWCDAFVDWCFKHSYGDAGAKELLGGYSNYTPTSAQYFKNMKRWFATPEVGDVIFFKNSTRICHTGIVERVDKNRVYTIEGNTSSKEGLVANGGCVARKSYALTYTRIAGFGRPPYDSEITNHFPTVKMGEVNAYVALLQRKLSDAGFKCSVDGNFGPNTKNALIAFQASKGLVKDGICGPKTWAAFN